MTIRMRSGNNRFNKITDDLSVRLFWVRPFHVRHRRGAVPYSISGALNKAIRDGVLVPMPDGNLRLGDAP